MDMPHSDMLLATSGELRMLIGQIRGYLSSTDQTGDDAIRDLWRRYVDASQQINQRLDLCSQLLERGEWIEAVRSAELEPDLFDCIAALEFERRGEWEQLGCDLGWERLIPVSPSVSDRLQAAWEHRRRIQPLLKEFLRLSIARAPLASRLAVMHKLAQKDHMSTFWREDIQTLERARGPQLLREFQEALRDHDAPALHTLLTELRETPWTLKVTASLKKMEARAEIVVLDQILVPEAATQLNTAWRERRDADGTRLLGQWNQHSGRLAELGPPDPDVFRALCVSTSKAREWAQCIVDGQSLEGAWRVSVTELEDLLQYQTTPWRELKARRLQIDQLFSQLPSAPGNRRIMANLDASYRLVRSRRLFSIAVTVAMIVAAVAVPGALVIMFVNWLYSAS